MEADTDVTFEDILEVIGHMGPAQILIMIFSYAIETLGGLMSNYFVIEMGNPGYFCLPVKLNTSDVTGNATWNGCPTETTECVNVTFSGEYTSVVTEWNFICGARYMAKLTGTLFFVGSLIGTICSGMAADIFGRRPVLLASWLLMIVSMSVLSLAPSWPVYAFIRIVSGMSSGAGSSVASILPMEYVGPKWRVIIGLRLGWRISLFLFVPFAYYIRNWRHLVLAIGLFLTPFLLLGCFLMPESSRWLIHKKRYGAAHKCLTFLAKLNRKPPPNFALVQRLGAQFERKEEKNPRYTYIDLFRTRYYVKVTLVLMFAWFSSSIISVGIKSEMTDLAGSLYANLLISACANFIARCLGVVVLTYLGRRWSYPVFTALPVISMVTILILDLTGYMEDREGIRTGLALASYGSATGNWLLIFVYASEVYPTLIRNIGTSAGNVAAYVGMIISPQIGLLSDVHKSLPYVVIGVTGLLCSVLMVIFMPETKGKPLPEELPARRKKKDRREVAETESMVTSAL